MSDNNLADDKRDLVIRMIRDGCSSHEISTKTGLTVGSIAAFKAQYTRGKYSLEVAETEEVAEALETKFGLERDLQRALRLNIEQLEPELRIIDGGTEQTVSSGRIDITAADKNGTTVIIELKSGEADREAIAQLLSYMGDIIGEERNPVRGILVASDFSVRAIAAARAVSTIELKRYRFKFSFESVE